MSFLQTAFKLVDNVTIPPGSSPYVTAALDLRGSPQQRIIRVNSILVQAVSAEDDPLLYDVYYAGGITSALFQANLGDVFEPNTANSALLDNIADDALHIAPMAAVYAPFVRFIILLDLTSAEDAVFNVWALCQERNDN